MVEARATLTERSKTMRMNKGFFTVVLFILGMFFPTVTTAQGQLPTVVTGDITDITPTGATCRLNVTDDGGCPIIYRGFIMNTVPVPSGSDYSYSASTGQVIINGLRMGQRYYIRAYAKNCYGRAWGEQKTFTTINPSLPTVTTAPVYDITVCSAWSGGTVTDGGGSDKVSRGLCWGEYRYTDLTNAWGSCSQGMGTGSFICFVFELRADTTYYVRAFARNEAGTAYGEPVAFKTRAPGPPGVTTNKVYNIGGNQAICSGTVAPGSFPTVRDRGFCWSTSPFPTKGNAYVSFGAGSGDYHGTVRGLIPSTMYYLRAYATNSLGTSYGEQVTFTTRPVSVLPKVITAQAVGITSSSARCGGTVVSNGGKPVTRRGVCWSLYPNPIPFNRFHQNGIGTGSFRITIDTLFPNTTFYVRAFACNENGIAFGDNEVFTTPIADPPSVLTSNVTGITATGAVCGGNVTADGGKPVIERGICWSRTPNCDPTTADGLATSGSGLGVFICAITNLTPNTTYYARAFAKNEVSTGLGIEKIFRTPRVVPAVITLPITHITAVKATGGGNIASNGGSPITARGVCWSTSQNPTTAANHTADGIGTGVFTSQIKHLKPDTTYYVRAYAINNYGTGYGENVSFTTNGAQRPRVTTAAVTAITFDSATCGGKVTSAGASEVIARGVCWSTHYNPSTAGFTTNDGTGTGRFTSSITGLDPGTVYYVRAYATNSQGTTYGGRKRFTTASDTHVPAVSTVPVTNITEISAWSGGEITAGGGSPVTERGVCWSKNGPPTTAGNKTSDGSGSGTFSSFITGLTPNTTYFVRAYGVNANGTGYGKKLSFKTENAGSPELSVSHTRLNFGAVADGAQTGSQYMLVSNTGSGEMSWSISSSEDWITVSPASGSGDAGVSVSIDSGGIVSGENWGQLTITAPGAPNAPVTVNIYAHLYTPAEAGPPQGELDSPGNGETISGSVWVNGWAVDDIKISAVDIYAQYEGTMEVRYLGRAAFTENSRPDIAGLYPHYPGHTAPGWSYRLLTRSLPEGDGTYDLKVAAMDIEGNSISLGTHRVTVANSGSPEPFGAVDTPTEGEVVSEDVYLCWGWVLTPQPNFIPYDGSTIDIYVDDTWVGNPVYDVYRSDVEAAFPGYMNSGGAGAYYYLDTKGYGAGTHTIQWKATDNDGNEAIISEKSFIILKNSQ